MGADVRSVDARAERPVAAAADEEPVGQSSRSITAAIAIPNPTHIDAMP